VRGWTEDLIRREETAGAIDLGAGGPRRRARGRVDYVLRVKVTLGWQQKSLQDVADLLPARSVALSGDSLVRVVTTACLSESGFKPAGIKEARMWAQDASQCVCMSGEILVARSNTRELVGRVSLFTGLPVGTVASDLTIRMRARPGCESHYLSGFLSSQFVRGYWKEVSGGASGSMKKITRKQILSLIVPLPSLSEQRRISARLNEQMGAATALRKCLEAQLAEIDALPNALLCRAFSGAL
jgi:hypothetical protein